jgi:heme-binding HmuY-like protein
VHRPDVRLRALVGPVLYTVDASDPEHWRYFSFHVGSVIENPGAKDWDLAFRRYEIIANGGREFVGGIVELGQVAFADVKTMPCGIPGDRGRYGSHNPAIANWYSYGYFSHVLRPRISPVSSAAENLSDAPRATRGSVPRERDLISLCGGCKPMVERVDHRPQSEGL